MTNIKLDVFSSFIWKFMELIGTQGIHFVISIILARLLSPEDYGVIAIVTIFITISSVLVQGGFNSSLIQKKDADEIDFSSVFFLNIIVSVVLYLVLFFATPSIALFYNEPKLVPVLRILGIKLIITALNSVQSAIISKNLKFKHYFFSSMASTIVSGFIGVLMAYKGYGVWSLVTQQIISSIAVTCVFWFTVKWRPRPVFSFERIKDLFKYGWKLLVSTLLNTGYNSYYSLVIGKYFSSEMLGYYNRGNTLPDLLISNINGSIGGVIFPALSANQENKSKIKSMANRAIVTSSFIVFPAMMGLVVCAEPLVRLLMTDKWLPCVPFMQILCFSYALWPVHTTNLQVINALGRSDIFLKLEIIKQVLSITVLLVSIRYGIYVMVALEAATGLICTVINAWPNKHLINYRLKEQFIDVLPSLILTIIMGVIVYSIKFIGLNLYITLFIQIIIGVLVYFGMAYLFKLECLSYLYNTIKEMVRNKFKNSKGKI